MIMLCLHAVLPIKWGRIMASSLLPCTFKTFFHVYECLLTRAYVHRVHAWCPDRPDESIWYSEVTDSYGPLCRCWEPNLGPWQEHQVFLTTESSLQPMSQDTPTPGHLLHQNLCTTPLAKLGWVNIFINITYQQRLKCVQGLSKVT